MPGTTGQPRAFTIMILDDEAPVREMIRVLVERMGHEVVEVEKAKDALYLLERGKAHLLLLDLNMPGASGLDMLKVLRRRHLPVPVVIVSAHVSGDVARQLAELGISGIVAKPFKRDRLETEINKAIGLRKPATTGGGPA